MDCLAGTPKVIIPVKNYEHFKNFEVSEEGEDDVTCKQRKELVK